MGYFIQTYKAQEDSRCSIGSLNVDESDTDGLFIVTEEEFEQEKRKYDILLTQFNNLNMEMLDTKQQNEGLIQQKKSLLLKLEELEATIEEMVRKRIGVHDK